MCAICSFAMIFFCRRTRSSFQVDCALFDGDKDFPEPTIKQAIDPDSVYCLEKDAIRKGYMGSKARNLYNKMKLLCGFDVYTRDDQADDDPSIKDRIKVTVYKVSGKMVECTVPVANLCSVTRTQLPNRVLKHLQFMLKNEVSRCARRVECI